MADQTPLERLAFDLADWLKVLSDDLESEVQGRFGTAYEDLHPALKLRYTRDMQPVVQARALLRHVRDVIPDWPRPPVDPSDLHDCEPVAPPPTP